MLLLKLAADHFDPEQPKFFKENKWYMGYRAKCLASTVPLLIGGAVDTLLVVPAVALNALTFGKTDRFQKSVEDSPLATLPAVFYQLLRTINPEAEHPGEETLKKGGFVYNFTAKFFEDINDEAASSDSNWSYHVTSRVAAVAAAALAVVACAGDAALAIVTMPLVLVRGGCDEKIAEVAFRSLTFPNMALLVVHCAMQFIYPQKIQQDSYQSLKLRA